MDAALRVSGMADTASCPMKLSGGYQCPPPGDRGWSAPGLFPVVLGYPSTAHSVSLIHDSGVEAAAAVGVDGESLLGHHGVGEGERVSGPALTVKKIR